MQLESVLQTVAVKVLCGRKGRGCESEYLYCLQEGGTRIKDYLVVHIGDVDTLLCVALVTDVHHQVVHGLDVHIVSKFVG